MQDDQFISDLREISQRYKHITSSAENLEKSGVRSYSQLFALLDNQQADSELKSDACAVILMLYKKVDRRRAVPPLLRLLKTPDGKLRSAVIRALGMLESKRAAQPLL